MSFNKLSIPDVLASRYASIEMCQIWSSEGKIKLERDFWIAVMKAQKQQGLDIPEEAIQAYEGVKEKIDLERIHQREKILRHDVKARIEEFCELAGFEHIHKGMTSRDLTDNVEQLQVLHSLKLIQIKYVAVLHRLSEWSQRTRDLMMVARTHNVPAQPTTLGKRFAMFGQEMLLGFSQLEHLIQTYPMRGLQGAVGTQLDQKTLLNDAEALKHLLNRIKEHLGFHHSLNAVGQVYPRSLDCSVLQCLYGLSSGISSFAKTLRLMAGHELMTEGFQKGQVGSSAMPHKMNTRNAERINGFHCILNGYVNMVMGLSGDQWNEGDVSCSVVRRVALPGAMYAMDGQIETMLTVLAEMGFYEEKIARELAQYLPFLATTVILMESLRKGSGRETVHEAIKTHAIAVTDALRSGKQTHNDLPERLSNDERIPLTLAELQEILKNPDHFIASAALQVDAFIQEVEHLLKQYPEAAFYQAQPLL